MIKYCDTFQCVKTIKLQKDQETLHPIPVLVKVWIKIGLDLFAPLKEKDSYRCIVTAVDYTSNFVGTEHLKEKLGR